MSDARDDLAKFLRERLSVLCDDMQWRCQAAELSEGDFRCMLTMAFAMAFANTVAQSISPNDDKELLRYVWHLIQHARKHEDRHGH